MLEGTVEREMRRGSERLKMVDDSKRRGFKKNMEQAHTEDSWRQ